VSGAGRELGRWQPFPQDGEEARALRTTQRSYPRWFLHLPVWFELEAEPAAATGARLDLEYKFVRDRRGLDDGSQLAEWEAGIPNRRISVPAEAGSIWIISHSSWNHSGDKPQVSRVTFADLRSWWSDLGIDVERIPLTLPTLALINKAALATFEEFLLSPKLTPLGHKGAADTSREPPWPIEAEFSADFSTSPRSPRDGHECGDMAQSEQTSEYDSDDEVVEMHDADASKENSLGEGPEAQLLREKILRLSAAANFAMEDSKTEDGGETEVAQLREQLRRTNEAAGEAAAKANAEIRELNNELKHLRSIVAEASTKDSQILELHLENQRLHRVLAEARERIGTHKNAALRESLEKASRRPSSSWTRASGQRWCAVSKDGGVEDQPEGDASQSEQGGESHKDLHEPQEEP